MLLGQGPQTGTLLSSLFPEGKVTCISNQRALDSLDWEELQRNVKTTLVPFRVTTAPGAEEAPAAGLSLFKPAPRLDSETAFSLGGWRLGSLRCGFLSSTSRKHLSDSLGAGIILHRNGCSATLLG